MGAAGQTTVVTVVMCDVVTYGLRSKGKTSLSPVRIRHEEWSAADSRRVWLVSHGRPPAASHLSFTQTTEHCAPALVKFIRT